MLSKCKYYIIRSLLKKPPVTKIGGASVFTKTRIEMSQEFQDVAHLREFKSISVSVHSVVSENRTYFLTIF